MNDCVLANNGERFDPVHHGYNPGNGYRGCHPQLMRLTCPDSWCPFGPGGLNGYAFCAGDPVNRADPSGHMSWQAGVGIGFSVLGIMGAIWTGGASVIAAGSISAALAATSTLSVAIGASALIADATSLGSAATEDTHPTTSAALGWISFAAGILSLGTGLAGGWGSSVYRTLSGVRCRMGTLLHTGLSGRGAVGASAQWALDNADRLDLAINGVEEAEKLFPRHFSHPLAERPTFIQWGKSGRGKAMSRFMEYYRDRNPGLLDALSDSAEQQVVDPLMNPPEVLRYGYRVSKWLHSVDQFRLPPHPTVSVFNMFADSPRDVAFKEVSKMIFFRAEEFRNVPPDPIAVEYLAHLYGSTGIREPLRFIHPLPDSVGFGPW